MPIMCITIAAASVTPPSQSKRPHSTLPDLLLLMGQDHEHYKTAPLRPTSMRLLRWNTRLMCSTAVLSVEAFLTARLWLRRCASEGKVARTWVAERVLFGICAAQSCSWPRTQDPCITGTAAGHSPRVKVLLLGRICRYSRRPEGSLVCTCVEGWLLPAEQDVTLQVQVVWRDEGQVKVRPARAWHSWLLSPPPPLCFLL